MTEHVKPEPGDDEPLMLIMECDCGQPDCRSFIVTVENALELPPDWPYTPMGGYVDVEDAQAIVDRIRVLAAAKGVTVT